MEWRAQSLPGGAAVRPHAVQVGPAPAPQSPQQKEKAPARAPARSSVFIPIIRLVEAHAPLLLLRCRARKQLFIEAPAQSAQVVAEHGPGHGREGVLLC